jgi:hypothetical protein
MPTRDLASPVATPVSPRAFHTSRCAVSQLAPAHHRRARAEDVTHRLRNAARNHPGRLRSTLPGLATGRAARSGLLSPESRQPEHHLHRPLRTRLVKDLGLRGQLASADIQCPKALTRRCEMPFVRSLQPTRCHEYPPVFRFPGLVLSHCRSPLHPSPRHARACARRTRRDPHRRRASVAGGIDPR